MSILCERSFKLGLCSRCCKINAIFYIFHGVKNGCLKKKWLPFIIRSLIITDVIDKITNSYHRGIDRTPNEAWEDPNNEELKKCNFKTQVMVKNL
jgi:hypothetical protein